MLQRLKALLIKDWHLVNRNYFVLISLFIVVLFAVLVNMVIPEEVSLEPTIYVVAEENNPFASQAAESIAGRSDKALVKSASTDIDALLKDNTQSFAMFIGGTEEAPTVRYHLQGHENQFVKNIAQLETELFFSGDLEGVSSVPVERLNTFKEKEATKFNLSMVPMFALTEPVLMGLFFIATMMFFEVEAKTVRAYAVSPGRIFEFLNSKMIMMLVLGGLSMLLVSLTTVGLSANYFHLLVILVSGSFFGSSVGLLIASFFDRLSKAFVWILVVTMMLTVPFASYYLPSFSPLFVRLMPTYSLMFALKEAYFATGNSTIIWTAAAYSILLGGVAYGIMFLNYRKRFAR